MIKRVIYVANDGEEFETEEECRAHENHMSRFSILRDKTHFVAYDKFKEKLSFDKDFSPEDFYDELEDILEAVDYCYCDKQAYPALKVAGEHFGLLVPPAEGYWRYDNTGYHDSFVSVQQDLEALENDWQVFGFQFLMKN